MKDAQDHGISREEVEAVGTPNDEPRRTNRTALGDSQGADAAPRASRPIPLFTT